MPETETIIDSVIAVEEEIASDPTIVVEPVAATPRPPSIKREYNAHSRVWSVCIVDGQGEITAGPRMEPHRFLAEAVTLDNFDTPFPEGDEDLDIAADSTPEVVTDQD